MIVVLQAPNAVGHGRARGGPGAAWARPLAWRGNGQVLVAHLARKFRVLRLKNRFAQDRVTPVTASALQELFYAAETGTGDDGEQYQQRYRDINLSVEARTPSGHPLVCEIQLTLSGIAILKKSEQRCYQIMRMEQACELAQTHVFSGEALSPAGDSAHAASEPAPAACLAVQEGRSTQSTEPGAQNAKGADDGDEGNDTPPRALAATAAAVLEPAPPVDVVLVAEARPCCSAPCYV